MDAPYTLLPGQRVSASGRPRLDYLAVIKLAFPFMLNSAVQAVLNATDTWFVGRLSPAATSAMGRSLLAGFGLILLFGGIALSVQTLVAHAYGAGRYARASQATWTALWGALLHACRCSPCSRRAAGCCSRRSGCPPARSISPWRTGSRECSARRSASRFTRAGILQRHRPARRSRCASRSWWRSRMLLLNQLFIFGFGLGVAGSAWATGAAQLAGLAMAFAWFFSPANRAPLPLASHQPVRGRTAAAPDLPRVSHGTPAGRRHPGIRALPAHAGAARERRRGIDARSC